MWLAHLQGNLSPLVLELIRVHGFRGHVTKHPQHLPHQQGERPHLPHWVGPVCGEVREGPGGTVELSGSGGRGSVRCVMGVYIQNIQTPVFVFISSNNKCVMALR